MQNTNCHQQFMADDQSYFQAAQPYNVKSEKLGVWHVFPDGTKEMWGVLLIAAPQQPNERAAYMRDEYNRIFHEKIKALN